MRLDWLVWFGVNSLGTKWTVQATIAICAAVFLFDAVSWRIIVLVFLCNWHLTYRGRDGKCAASATSSWYSFSEFSPSLSKEFLVSFLKRKLYKGQFKCLYVASLKPLSGQGISLGLFFYLPFCSVLFIALGNKFGWKSERFSEVQYAERTLYLNFKYILNTGRIWGLFNIILQFSYCLTG